MKKFIKENYLMLIFIITSLINSCLLRYLTGANGLMIRPLLGDLLIILLICAFSYLFKKKKLYFLLASFLLVAICCLNSMYFNEYHDFVSVYLIETLFQAFKMPSEAVTEVIEIVDYIFIWQFIVMLVVCFISKFKYNKNKKYFKNTLIVCFTLLILLILSCNSNDLYRLRNDWNKEYTVNNFGVYTYQIKDIMYTLSRSLCKDCGKNKALKEVNEYYKTKKEATSNKYTNIFKGKNLLFVHAESIQTMFVDKELNGNKLMPNLSKIANEGIYFDNYYSQESVGTSSDTEFTLNNSLLPIGTGTVFVNFENNNYESIPKILKQQNYYTFSMHANVCNFWNRDKMYQSMGYDHFYCYNDYDLSDKLGLGLSDKSFFKQSVAKIKDMKVDNFYGTLIMLSNHTPFNGNDEINKFDVSIKQDGKVYPYVENTKIGRYLKMVHYADAAIGDLIKQLDEASLLDNTVIIIYGDHDSKLKTKEYDRYLNYNINTNSILDKKDLNYEEINFYKYEEISRVPFIIWTKDNQIKEKVSQVMGTIDILPTLGNMFGFKSKYALGNDIFSIKDNMVVFPNGNWVTNSVYYNNQTSDYKVFNEVDDIYLKDKESKAKKIVEISNYLIKYNLFNK